MVRENKALAEKLHVVQEELRTRENRWYLAFNMEQEKWGKERQGENEALTNRTVKLQYQPLDLDKASRLRTGSGTDVGNHAQYCSEESGERK